MKNIEERQFELLKEIGFVRTSGTEEELLAANILREKLNSLGVESKLEPFKVSCYNMKKAKLEILEPFNKEYTVTGMGFSGNTEEEGLTADFEYVEQAEPINLVNVKGKIVLINGGLTIKKYENIIKAGAVGFITFSGTVLDDEEKTDIEKRMLREKHLEFGKVPGVNVRVKDALEMVALECSKVRITVLQEEGEAESHNLIADIKGTDYPEEVVVIMAHYDSVPFSKGVYDNGAGSVIIMELLRHYLENPPKRTIRFIWFGSEERGLLGSKDYVKSHESELEAIKFGINVDVAGAILGEDKALVTGDESLCNMIEYFSKEVCFPITVKQSIYSSDCIPFADKGIPVVNFGRFGANGATKIHSRYDILDYLSPKYLYKTMNFVKDFSEKIINAYVFPVPRKMPENMVKDIDKYLKKKDCKNK
ncbi:M28 family peptidase [Oceanirhabdus seepicola]|uniref:Carboxypeptidase Q n=1 Tax=Oceanirhabdus seepicola TaxID=2828781 RepID=A0A9J6NX94_9CLOT|nr:M28 family peptidase [Oceanirhabdus seepicola]MCM1988513.1 M20/M25/M40 family metallo-hydrolase [Oceanirhabdus seepicola]